MIIDSKTGKKFVGFYKGQVLSHLDNGYCKIWIPGVYPEEWKAYGDGSSVDAYGNPIRGAKLPSASPSFPPVGGGGPHGIFAIPALNSMVWCFFENDDPNYPVYFATIPGNRTVETLNEMTNTTKEKPINWQAVKDGHAELERDVIIRFGRAYILFSPNDRIEIGFRATDKKKGEVSEAAVDNPKIILDKSGQLQIIAQGGIKIDGSGGTQGVSIMHDDSSVVVNKASVTVNAPSEDGRVKLNATHTLEITSDYQVSVQGEFDVPGPCEKIGSVA